MYQNPIQLKHVIGRGSHGTVYLGYHRNWQKMVAVKKIKDGLKARQEAATLEEMQDCSYVVRYFNNYPDEDGNLLIVMQHLEGPTASTVIDEVSNGMFIPESTIQRLAEGMGFTILHCHERGMMYGDIKPSNMIMRPTNGEITMIDVGAVRHGYNFTRPVGTPLFFAPEKFMMDYGHASDVWSMGVVLYMLVCGHHPFIHMAYYRNNNSSVLELQTEIDSTQLTFHHPNWDNMSDHFKDLLSKMLIKDPQKRITIDDALAHKWWVSNL